MKLRSITAIVFLCLILVGCGASQAFNYVSQGNEYAGKGDYWTAIAEYEKAIELDPEYAEAYYHRAKMYILLYYPGLALADVDKAIELDPEYAEAHYVRGIVYKTMGENGNAIENLERALELGLSSPFKELAEESLIKLKE